MTSKGSDLHRRGLYTFLKRTAPYPTFTTFDASSREVCTVRRGRTNTPLQALNLLNDPAFFEAAQGLAKRAVEMTETVESLSTRLADSSAGPTNKPAWKQSSNQAIATAFRLCTARHPKREELARLVTLYESLRTKYEKAPDEAKKLAPTPEQAAMVMVANVILNLDETITKE